MFRTAIQRVAAHVSVTEVLFGLASVAAFWMAIRLCRSTKGKRWYDVAARLVGALALVGLGVLMIFYTAFGAAGD